MVASSHTEGLSCAKAQGQGLILCNAVGMAGRQKGREHERVGEMRRWETPKMEVWGFPLGRGIQEAITFRLVWVFGEMDLIQIQV